MSALAEPSSELESEEAEKPAKQIKKARKPESVPSQGDDEYGEDVGRMESQ